MNNIKVAFFKSTQDTKRFKKGQRVWFQTPPNNGIMITYKFRGSAKGRYVKGYISGESPHIGEISIIDIDQEFVKRQNLWIFTDLKEFIPLNFQDKLKTKDQQPKTI